MTITKKTKAGTLESNDLLVEIEPSQAGIEISLTSIVKAQFGEAIENAVRTVLAAQEVTAAKLTVTDRGALECTIRARVETAVRRAK